MTNISAYLHFNGNCREAMEFYKDALGWQLELMTIGDSPMAEQMPDKKDLIMHACLFANNDRMLFASDMAGVNQSTNGNMMSLCLSCESETEINDAFAKLSVGAKSAKPLKEEFWGAIYGEVVDKFDIRWMFNFDKNAGKK